MSNQSSIERLIGDLVRSSVALKRTLYKADEFASTTSEQTEGPTTRVHVCRVCNRMAAGEKAHIRHRKDCALAALQEAQKRLRESWPELFVTAKKSAG
jgi:hypothetical protein